MKPADKDPNKMYETLSEVTNEAPYEIPGETLCVSCNCSLYGET